MQKRFPASEKALPEVLREIRKAKRRNELITTVQFGFGERSLRRMTNELKGVKHLSVTKFCNDGGPPIYNALVRCFNSGKLGVRKIDLTKIKKLRICGVNTAGCVMSTVESLSFLRWPIEVIANACANDFGGTEERNQASHLKALRVMNKWKNVTVV